VLAGLALAIAVLALVLGGLLWQRLDAAQRELARRSQESVSLADQARQISAQAEALTQELQARLTVAEVRLSEVSLQRSQLEELMLTLSRSRDDNLVQDIESTLRLAQQQAQLTGSVAPLLSALQAA
jgi:uroporphyrin-3 C-methyltransferase